MKKSVFKLLPLMALMVLLLAACGGGTSGETSEGSSSAENALAGKTYEYVSMQIDGKDFELPDGLKGRKLTFNDDGTFLLAGYRSEKDKITVKDMTGTYKIEGDSLTMIIDWDPEYMVFDGEESYASNEDLEEQSEESRTDRATISGDDLNFAMDVPKYDDQGNETGETEHQTWVYTLVK